MRRKLVSGIAVCLLAALGAHAQTEKGNWLVGGNFQLNTTSTNTVIGVTPMGGKFVVKNLAVGADVNLTYNKAGSDKVTQFSVGPFARYYFLNGPAKPLVQAGIGFLSTKSSGAGYSSTNNGTTYFLGGGLAYFINDNVSLEGVAGYNHTKINSYSGSGGFLFTIGFQVYLHSDEVEKLRGK